MNVVITQSMFFPWIGILEQIKLANVLIHYDDVQFSKGSFTNRVQIKTLQGSKWMTVPLDKQKIGQSIKEVKIKPINSWKNKHLKFLEHNFSKAPFKYEALQIVYEIYSKEYNSISELSKASMMKLVEYFNIDKDCIKYDVSELNINGSSDERVLKIVQKVGGKVYITGHGAKNYLDHLAFEDVDIEVKYMQYKKLNYPQQFGEFTPFVSGLDLVANCGKDGEKYIDSQAVNWKKFINKQI